MTMIEKFIDNQWVRDCASWLKEQAHAVRVIGGLLLGFALLLGLIWMFGVDLDAAAFFFSVLASVFFALPSVAEYILPSRKPVRHMSYEELLGLLDATEPDEWKVIHTNWAGEAFFIEDPRLRFRVRHDEAGEHSEDFRDDWVDKCPRHTGQSTPSYWYDYFHDGNLIERFVMVHVDGNRAVMPMPDTGTLEVPNRRFRVARIFDRNDKLFEYMKITGLSAKNT
jgi:hypothetical protein